MFTLVALEAVLAISITGEPRFEIAYATYLGGSGWDEAREVIPYPDGSVLIGAQSCSPDMPVVEGAFQPRYAGDDPRLGHPGLYGGDCYLARISPDGRKLIAATYFGGSKQERNVYGMELDREGNVVITSMTRSSDLPVTDGSFQMRHGGGPGTIFVAKLTGDLRELLWCTYLGGSGDESPRGGLALDDEGNVYVFGTTASPDFPTTEGAYRRKLNGPRDAFVAKLSADGSELIWSTLFGGSSEDFMVGGCLDREGNVYFVGHTTSPDLPVTLGCAQPGHGGKHDAYAVKLSADGGQVLYATYLGGSENEFPEHRPALLPDGSLLIPGVTASPDFPATPGAYQRKLKGGNDAFLTRLSPDGGLIFSTLLGGSGTEVSLMPTLSPDGTIFLVGTTSSPDLPVTPDAFQHRFGGGESDGWIAELSPDGSQLLFCSYLGGSGKDMIRSIAFGPGGEIFLVGHTFSKDFPVSEGALQTAYGGGGDAFVVKLVPRR